MGELLIPFLSRMKLLLLQWVVLLLGVIDAMSNHTCMYHIKCRTSEGMDCEWNHILSYHFTFKCMD